MDLPAITAFVAVGDKGGFRAAASTLGMSSAGVSKAVARLEAQLGVTLVARTTRSVRLTTAGAAFHARCKAILADLDQAGQEAAEGAALTQGRLVISAPKAFGRLRVLAVIADYVKHHSQVEIEARFSDRVVDLVGEGVDLAIRIGDLPPSGLIATRIGEAGFILCGSPDYLAQAGEPRHPDDLHRHVVVGYVAPETAVRLTYRFMVEGEVRTMNLPSRLTVDDGEAAVAAGVRSVGLVMTNDYLMEQQLADGSLVRVLRNFELPAIPISVVRPPARNLSRVTQLFVDLLRRRMAR